MFGNFMSMFGNYENRKVDRYDEGDLFVSTAEVFDSKQPYETAVKHPDYNDGKIVIVEMYNTKEEAQEGHDKWVTTITTEPLPNQLKDVSTAEAATILKERGDNMVYPRNKIDKE